MTTRLFGVIAALCLLGSSADAGVWSNLLGNAFPGNLLVEDGSREAFVDVNRSGFLDAGDALVGYAKADTTQPGGDAGNSLYAVFSQTFASVTAFPTGPFTRYSGTFAPTAAASPASLQNLLPSIHGSTPISPSALIALVEQAGGFGTDLTTTNFPAGGGVTGLIGSVLDGGSLASTFGLVKASDFFAFESAPLGPGTDFVAGGISVTEGVSVSLPLGNFGAGLSVIDNPNNSLFYTGNVTSNFFQATTGTFFGSAVGDFYDLAVLNGNFGGINLGGVGNLLQGATPGANQVNFINNADLVSNAQVVPEPASLLAFAAIGVVGMGVRRRRR